MTSRAALVAGALAALAALLLTAAVVARRSPATVTVAATETGTGYDWRELEPGGTRWEPRRGDGGVDELRTLGMAVARTTPSPAPVGPSPAAAAALAAPATDEGERTDDAGGGSTPTTPPLAVAPTPAPGGSTGGGGSSGDDDATAGGGSRAGGGGSRDRTPTSPAPAPRTAPAGWPGPDTTGVRPGVRLRPSGDLTITRDGAVVEGLDVTGMITVDADDVTIRNVRVRTGDRDFGIRVHNDTRRTVVEDSEVLGGSQCKNGITRANYTARRVEVTGCSDGFRARGDVLIEDSWVHDLRRTARSHNDPVQVTDGRNIVIRDNNLQGPPSRTSAIIVKSDFGGIDDVQVLRNRLEGGAFTLYVVHGKQGRVAQRGVEVRDNVFVADSARFGTHQVDPGVVVWSGNTDTRGRTVRE